MYGGGSGDGIEHPQVYSDGSSSFLKEEDEVYKVQLGRTALSLSYLLRSRVFLDSPGFDPSHRRSTLALYSVELGFTMAPRPTRQRLRFGGLWAQAVSDSPARGAGLLQVSNGQEGILCEYPSLVCFPVALVVTDDLS